MKQCVRHVVLLDGSSGGKSYWADGIWRNSILRYHRRAKLIRSGTNHSELDMRILIAIVALVLAGCNSGGKTDSVPDSSTTSGTPLAPTIALSDISGLYSVHVIPSDVVSDEYGYMFVDIDGSISLFSETYRDTDRDPSVFRKYSAFGQVVIGPDQATAVMSTYAHFPPTSIYPDQLISYGRASSETLKITIKKGQDGVAVNYQRNNDSGKVEVTPLVSEAAPIAHK